jgi:glycosyltransferase involved in cell wall biosynthesis
VSTPGIVVILSGFPRRSETFALAEVSALAAAGRLAAVFATKPGEDGPMQPDALRIASRVRVLCGDPASQADQAAAALKGIAVAGVHAYFAHEPSEVGAALADRLGVPFGFSVHARDARKVLRGELHARARRAACVIACNADVAREFDGSQAPLHIAPHGVDLERFKPNGRRDSSELRLLAVGRLVQKKGFDVLLDALSTLDIPWRLRLIGEGPDREHLIARSTVRGVAHRVCFCGPKTHDELPQEYQRADVVVVPSVQDQSGDRDGLPNVVLEAMASGCVVVASDVGAISSAVQHRRTGLLVRPHEVDGLASALETVAHDVEGRRWLGHAARRFVEREFDVVDCTARLISILDAVYA